MTRRLHGGPVLKQWSRSYKFSGMNWNIWITLKLFWGCLYILVLHWCQSGWVGGGRWFEMRKIFLRYFTREWAITSASLTKCPFDVCNCVQNVKKYCFFANLWCWCYLRIDKFWIQITIWWWWFLQYFKRLNAS